MSEKPEKVLVTGAAGAIGGLLVEELASRGFSVRAAVRSSAEFPADVEVLSGDLRDPQFVMRAAEGVRTIFHFAAKLHVNDPSGELRDEYESSNVEATRLLLEHSECERFIFASTINVYGTGGPFDEKSATRPDGLYAGTKLEAENLVLRHPGGTVLRFAAVYGRRMKGNFPRLVSAIGKGMFAFVGRGTNRRTLVHERDAIGAAILCAEMEESKGKLFNVTDGGVHTLEEIVAAISRALGRTPPSLHLPESLARAAFSGGDVFLKMAGREIRLTPLIDKINEDIAVSGSRIQEELGFKPEYGLEEGWKEALGGS